MLESRPRVKHTSVGVGEMAVPVMGGSTRIPLLWEQRNSSYMHTSSYLPTGLLVVTPPAFNGVKGLLRRRLHSCPCLIPRRLGQVHFLHRVAPRSCRVRLLEHTEAAGVLRATTKSPCARAEQGKLSGNSFSSANE